METDGNPEANTDVQGQTQDTDPAGQVKAPPAASHLPKSQEELEGLISKRLARKEREWKLAADEARKQAEMTEAEKLKAAADAAQAEVLKVRQEATLALAQAEAQVQLVAAGVKPERVARALRLIDFSTLDPDESGKIPPADIKAACASLVADVPELVSISGAPKAGGDIAGGNPDPPLTTELIATMDPATLDRRGNEIEAFFKRKRAG